jgi:hypothetical protein
MGQVDPSKCKNKSGYYHSCKTKFKGWLDVRPVSRVRLTVDSGQRKDKSDYYYNFKINLEGRVRANPGPCARGSTQVDPGYYKNKSDYYNSFKTWFVSQPMEMLGSRSGRLIWVNVEIKVVIIIVLKPTRRSTRARLRLRVGKVNTGWPKSNYE